MPIPRCCICMRRATRPMLGPLGLASLSRASLGTLGLGSRPEDVLAPDTESCIRDLELQACPLVCSSDACVRTRAHTHKHMRTHTHTDMHSPRTDTCSLFSTSTLVLGVVHQYVPGCPGEAPERRGWECTPKHGLTGSCNSIWWLLETRTCHLQRCTHARRHPALRTLL